MDADAIKILQAVVDQQKTLAKKKVVAKALGIKFEFPSIHDQICCKGKVANHKHGRSVHGREKFIIPVVELKDDRTVSMLAIEPCCAREVALEILRLADSTNW